MVRVVLFWGGLAVVTAVLGTLAIVTRLVDRRGTVIQRYSRAWGRAGLWLAGSRADLSAAAGAAPAVPPGSVIVSNHQSTMDIFAIASALPGQLRWVAKRELFRIPIFGPAMRAAGYVPIDREDPRRSRRGLSRAAEALAQGASLVVFPEGTRSADGRLGPFKRGAFALAQASRAPVVPVAVRGSRAVLPAGRWRVRPGRIEVVVGRPIPSADLSQPDLVVRAREAVAALLGQDAQAAAPATAAASP
ncbi:MAG TPA: lysophospholipid acyltransferase family protein [Thermodesulfobacteriota bacterium]